MKQYEVYVGIGGRDVVPSKLTHLENFALGLGVPGFTEFEAVGGWTPPAGDPVFEPVVVFRFILDGNDPFGMGQISRPWSIAAFAAEAKRVFEQQEILVTVTDVDAYSV